MVGCSYLCANPQLPFQLLRAISHWYELQKPGVCSNLQQWWEVWSCAEVIFNKLFAHFQHCVVLSIAAMQDLSSERLANYASLPGNLSNILNLSMWLLTYATIGSGFVSPTNEPRDWAIAQEMSIRFKQDRVSNSALIQFAFPYCHQSASYKI